MNKIKCTHYFESSRLLASKSEDLGEMILCSKVTHALTPTTTSHHTHPPQMQGQHGVQKVDRSKEVPVLTRKIIVCLSLVRGRWYPPRWPVQPVPWRRPQAVPQTQIRLRPAKKIEIRAGGRRSYAYTAPLERSI